MQTLSSLVSEDHLADGRTFPPLEELLEISVEMAVRIANWAYDNKMAARYPRPENMEEFFRSHLYSTKYESFIPDVYDWPDVSGN